MHDTYRALGRNAHVKACASPRRHIEKNPICTTNNQTFINPYAAICFAGGVIHLREKVGGTCDCPTQRSCERVQKLQESLKSASLNENYKVSLQTNRDPENVIIILLLSCSFLIASAWLKDEKIKTGNQFKKEQFNFELANARLKYSLELIFTFRGSIPSAFVYNYCASLYCFNFE